MGRRVRDAGVAGSNPATPTKNSLGFSSFFTIGRQVNPGNNPRYDVLLWFRRDSCGCIAQELRMMVAVRIK
jgi:hypothetical protein